MSNVIQKPTELDDAIPQPGESVSPEPATPTDERLHLLRRVVALLERADRARSQEDFSVRRLAGTLLQLLAVAAGLWGLIALFSDQPAAAVARFGLAILLQVMALSAAVLDRWR